MIDIFVGWDVVKVSHSNKQSSKRLLILFIPWVVIILINHHVTSKYFWLGILKTYPKWKGNVYKWFFTSTHYWSINCKYHHVWKEADLMSIVKRLIHWNKKYIPSLDPPRVSNFTPFRSVFGAQISQPWEDSDIDLCTWRILNTDNEVILSTIQTIYILNK